ncbi:hypothetical protein NliqN6_3135 [Naganishia liquefaciens]|uniref:ubiquitinyl hydrolase 1 n=1 Tax=Naganishia liquefaciens TaxID=104408 RepID=A0A8H3TTR9_9TREE|nr:hypothetical protein NliqN6_3135 [Naganishia liquefaciens]
MSSRRMWGFKSPANSSAPSSGISPGVQSATSPQGRPSALPTKAGPLDVSSKQDEDEDDDDELLDGREEKYFGLENFGNTCYANSVIQVLYHCDPFRQFANAYPNITLPTIPIGPSPTELIELNRKHAQELLEAENGTQANVGTGSSDPKDNGFQSPASAKNRWSMAMRTRSMSTGVAPGTSVPGTLPKLQTNMAPVHERNSTVASPPTSPTVARNAGRSLQQKTESSEQPLQVNTDPNAPTPSMLSTIQSVFQYISTSDSHPPPPPKEETAPPPGTGTSGGSTLINPHKPNQQTVRGGGPHGAGTLGKGVARPEELVKTAKRENEMFRGAQHQDAHEFLMWVLNQVSSDVEQLETRMAKDPDLAGKFALNGGVQKKRAKGKTFVQSLFEGTMTNEIKCLTCETVTSRDEAFLDLSLDIEQNSSVSSCLRQFSASEMLDGKNKFSCETCCGLQEAERSVKIKRAPNILALHLKRFKYIWNDNGVFMRKLSYRINFGSQLKLFNMSEDSETPDRLYELIAVLVHIGGGTNQGHYVAAVKSKGQWMLCDDENVEPIQEADLVRYFGEYQAGAGYVLFYQAADIDLASLGLATPEPAKAAAPAAQPTSVPFSVQAPTAVQAPVVSNPFQAPVQPSVRLPAQASVSAAPVPAPVAIADPIPVQATVPSSATPGFDPLSPTFSQVGPILDIDPTENAMSPQQQVLAALSDYRSGEYETQTPESMTPPMSSPGFENDHLGRPRTSSSASALAPGAIRIGADRFRSSSPPSSAMGGYTPARESSVSSAGKGNKTGNWLSRRTSNRDDDKDKSKRSVYESSRPSTSRTESSSQMVGYGLNGGANDFKASERRPTDPPSPANGLGLTVPRASNGNHSNGTTPASRSRSQTVDTSTSGLTTPSRDMSGSFVSYESSTTGSVPNSAPVSRGPALAYQQHASTSPTPHSSSSPTLNKSGSASTSPFGGLGLGKKKEDKEKPRTPSGGGGMLKRSLSGVSMKPMLSRSSSSVLKNMMGIGKKERDNTLESVSERR